MTSNNPQSLPTTLQTFLKTIQTDLPNIIPENLVGIYIYGSISYGDFAEGRSDVDVAAVVKRRLNKDERQKLNDWYKSEPMTSSPWLKKLEMDYIVFEDISINIKNRMEASRFAGGKLKETAIFDGAILDWENIRSCGIVLYGEDPKSFIPETDEKLLFEALADKFQALKENIFDWVKIDLWNQVYVVVQLCRVIYALKNHGQPVSKKAAAEWCEKNLPDQFRSMVSVVLNKMDNFTGPLENVISDNLEDLVKYVQRLFKKI